MSDMLVKLYDLPDVEPKLDLLKESDPKNIPSNNRQKAREIALSYLPANTIFNSPDDASKTQEAIQDVVGAPRTIEPSLKSFEAEIKPPQDAIRT